MLNKKKTYRLPDILLAVLITVLFQLVQSTPGQAVSKQDSIPIVYLDPQNGMTADLAVAAALENNGEIQAIRKETDAARELVKQARLRPNPSVEFSRQEQIGGKDNDTMIAGSLPLELGGRRGARVKVAEAELAMREAQLANSERMLAADVRAKFGEALANTLKQKFTEDLLQSALNGFSLVQARVAEGKTPPLEESMTLVEVNRLRSMLETVKGRSQISLLELRNLLGMKPEDRLSLRGDFGELLTPPPALGEATQQALQNRPDLQAVRAGETFANAQIEQARAAGRIDASVSAGYGRNDFSFPVNGITNDGLLRPVQGVFHSVRFGITLQLPVRNRNQGAVAAAVANADAAARRLEFADLTVRREVASAYARYESSARAMEIYRVGVENQAEANLDVVRQTYELGSRTLLDYIAEERRFIEIKNGFIDLQFETYLARLEILKAINAPELKKK